jgi:uncharacterized protein YndB with AHSA1/START domain
LAELKHQIAIKSTPEKVYAALTTEAGFRHWWTADAKAEEKVAGKAEFGFDKRATVFRMKIEKLNPGKDVVWSCNGDNPEWAGTTLTWSISSENGMSVVRFTHSGWKSASELYAICNSSWGELMHRLRDYVEGKNPGPHWKE